MMDKITLDRIKLLHPKLREEAMEIFEEINKALTGKAICRFSHTLRTFAEQDALFAQGRTKPGKRVTNARGGESMHNYGLAIDIVLLVDRDGNGSFESAVWDTKTDFDGDRVADWMEIVKIFKMHGWTWGGDWKFVDPPHFEKSLGKPIVEMRRMHAAGKVDKQGYVLL